MSDHQVFSFPRLSVGMPTLVDFYVVGMDSHGGPWEPELKQELQRERERVMAQLQQQETGDE